MDESDAKIHKELSERLKLALNMPGTGNYVRFAEECRAAWERKPVLIAALRDMTTFYVETLEKDGICPEGPRLKMALQALGKPAYPEFCRDPVACSGNGFCPRDPTCVD